MFKSQPMPNHTAHCQQNQKCMTYHTNVVRFVEPDLRFRHDLKRLNVVRFDKSDLKSG